MDDQLRVSIANDLESIRAAVSNSGKYVNVPISFQLFRGIMEQLDRQQVRLAELGIADDPVLQLQLHDLALQVIQSFIPKLKLPESATTFALAGDQDDDVNILLRMVQEEERKRALAARNAAIICKGSSLEY